MPKTTVGGGASNAAADAERGSESHTEPSGATKTRTKPSKPASGQPSAAQGAKKATAKTANGAPGNGQGGDGPAAA